MNNVHYLPDRHTCPPAALFDAERIARAWIDRGQAAAAAEFSSIGNARRLKLTERIVLADRVKARYAEMLHAGQRKTEAS